MPIGGPSPMRKAGEPALGSLDEYGHPVERGVPSLRAVPDLEVFEHVVGQLDACLLALSIQEFSRLLEPLLQPRVPGHSDMPSDWAVCLTAVNELLLWADVTPRARFETATQTVVVDHRWRRPVGGNAG